MRIDREEDVTGGPERTPREMIETLVTDTSWDVEVEKYVDSSESEGWDWSRFGGMSGHNTWDIQTNAMKAVLVPVEAYDSMASKEQAGGSDEQGGAYAYGFSNRFQAFGDPDDEDDGDLNTSNFERKMNLYQKNYFRNGKPQGGTTIMRAVAAGDKHYLKEFPKDEDRAHRVRLRIVWTDGALADEGEFRRYLAKGTHDKATGFGQHEGWHEIWVIAIIGPKEGGGRAAYQQYAKLAEDHPWIHPYNFEDVVNSDEIAEDIAVAITPHSA